jgi:hypothetical protein
MEEQGMNVKLALAEIVLILAKACYITKIKPLLKLEAIEL